MRLIFSLLGLALLAGCTIGVDVRVEQLSGGRISIEAARRGLFGGDICVEEVTISHAATTRPGHFVDWGIRRDDGAPCRTHFSYPDVPEGYHLLGDESFDADPDFPRADGLIASKEYNASVSGAGFSSGAIFIRDGALSPNQPSPAAAHRADHR